MIPTAKSVSVEIGGRPLTIETGKYAKQAAGAVVIRQGDTMVLVTAGVGGIAREGDFFPLTVDYTDRTGAYGRIPGGYFRREGRSSERETLISRLIDRPIRPMCPKTFRNEVQIIATLMSYETGNDADVLSLCGASAALAISPVPMERPVAGVRLARVNGEFLLNPAFAVLADADLNIVVAGTADAIIMVEGGSKGVNETVMLEALEYAHKAVARICAAIDELREMIAPVKMVVPAAKEMDAELVTWLHENGDSLLADALATKGKHERSEAVRAAGLTLIARRTVDMEPAAATKVTAEINEIWYKMNRAELRNRILDQGMRVDGRATDEIRPIWCEVTVAPRAHGSAVFTRGETQVFATVALGTDDDAQRLELPTNPDTRRTWMLTYNFAPYCVGEVMPLRAPKRREVGHGALAHRGIEAVLPGHDIFPYVLRSTCEVMESNGSSSMATVCATTLALMDAGVPIKAPVAGIAMGLVKEGEKWAVLSDIIGDEDHLGDMDFKVTGTTEGITAFQMDVKISGVSRDIMARALAQAREGRLHILGEMALTLEGPRPELSQYAPRISTIYIKQDRIRDIIGPGGKVIRSIQERTGTKVAVDDSGRVDVAATDAEAAARAIGMIRELTQEAEIGKLYVGVVKRIMDFGAFVEIFPGTEGLIHISHLSKDRVNKVTDVVNEGDEVLVRVIDVDKAGKIRLSRKEAIEAAGSY